MRSHLFALATVITILARPAASPAVCAGDCGGDDRVTVDEVILGINIVLGLVALGQCEAVDANADGTATVVDLVRAVSSVLAGCADVSPTPTPSPTPPPGEVGRTVFLSTDQTTFLGEIFAIDADGGNRINLTNTPDRSEGQPSWSPDGQQIAFNVDTTAIVVMNADGSGRRMLVEDSEGVGYPSWSRDGGAVVFAGADFHSIELVNADGSGRTAIVPADEFEYLAPTFSPDGSEIAFVSNRAGGTGAALEIFAVPAGGGAVTRLTDDENENASTDWSAGGAIAFGSFRFSPAPQGGIYAVDADGTNERLLVADAMFPSWSADGATLVFSSFNGIAIANADGSGVRAVPNTTSNDVDPDVQ